MKCLSAYFLPALVLSQSVPLIDLSRTAWTTVLTANDVLNGVCAPLTVIFARGTNEPGNVGDTVGQPLFRAFSNLLNGNVALQGVNYQANNYGNVVKGATGAPSMTALAEQARSQCNETKIALIGYSQGASVTHYALNNGTLSSSIVDAIAVFGDPQFSTNGTFGSVPASHIKEYCNEGDYVCEAGVGNITAAHIAYMSNGAAQDAAWVVVNVTGLADRAVKGVQGT